MDLYLNKLKIRYIIHGKFAVIKKGIDIIGKFGMINPRVIKNFDIKEDVYILELNMEKLARYTKKKGAIKDVQKFPSVSRDISMFVSKDTKYSEIENIITKQNKKLIEKVELFDIYEGEEKSIAVRIVFTNPNKTLEEQEVNQIMDKITSSLEKIEGLQIRK